MQTIKEDVDSFQTSELGSSRQARESEFHDEWANVVEISEIAVMRSFESITAGENRYILERLGNLKDKRILDLGCGIGDASVYFALQGAHVKSIDISPGMITVTQKLAAYHNVSERVSARTMAAENLDFSSETFDYVYGNGVLHHVDYMKALDEVRRVLKPGGKALFVEPLGYNPVIWIYRKMASKVRSQDEKPLFVTDVRDITDNNMWESGETRFFHLFTLLIMVWFYVGDKLHPSRVRYWKHFIENGDEYARLYKLLSSLDNFLFQHIPGSKWMSWNTVIELSKSGD